MDFEFPVESHHGNTPRRLHALLTDDEFKRVLRSDLNGDFEHDTAPAADGPPPKPPSGGKAPGMSGFRPRFVSLFPKCYHKLLRVIMDIMIGEKRWEW